MRLDEAEEAVRKRCHWGVYTTIGTRLTLASALFLVSSLWDLIGTQRESRENSALTSISIQKPCNLCRGYYSILLHLHNSTWWIPCNCTAEGIWDYLEVMEKKLQNTIKNCTTFISMREMRVFLSFSLLFLQLTWTT